MRNSKGIEIADALGLRKMPVQKPGLSKQDYGTPHEFIAAVCELLAIPAFAYDLAAHSRNVIPGVLGYCSIEDGQDSLKTDWHVATVGGWLWLNPPFGEIEPWARKCVEESLRGAKIAFLVPASVGANWFRDHVLGKGELIFLNGRLSFDGKAPYPKDCMIILFHNDLPVIVPRARYAVWDWRKQNILIP